MSSRLLNNTAYSLLIIIIKRGKGSKVLEFVYDMGARDASCFIGKGTVKNKFLQIIEMDEVDKEVVLIIVPSDREAEFLERLNIKFHLERKNHGIAFTIPLAGTMKMNTDAAIQWPENCGSDSANQDYTALFMVADKGEGEKIIQVCHDAGYYGGTIIKAHGTACQSSIILDMMVEREREAVLMLVPTKLADKLTPLLGGYVTCADFFIKMDVSRTIGLFQNDKSYEVVEK